MTNFLATRGRVRRRPSSARTLVLGLALAITGCGKDPARLMEEGKASFELGLHDAALERYQEVQRSHAAEFPEVHERIGDVYAAQKRVDAALAAWRQALPVSKHPARIQNKLGAFLLQAGQLEAAQAAFEAALAAEPESGDTVFNLGVLELKRGRYEAARTRFLQAKVRRPGDPQVEKHLAIACDRAGRTREAAEALFRVFEIDAAKAGDLGSLLAALLLEEMWAEAAKVGVAAGRDQPDPMLLLRTGYALWRSGDIARGRNIYQAARSLELPALLQENVEAVLAKGPEAVPPPGFDPGPPPDHDEDEAGP